MFLISNSEKQYFYHRPATAHFHGSKLCSIALTVNVTRHRCFLSLCIPLQYTVACFCLATQESNLFFFSACSCFSALVAHIFKLTEEVLQCAITLNAGFDMNAVLVCMKSQYGIYLNAIYTFSTYSVHLLLIPAFFPNCNDFCQGCSWF